MTEQEPAMCLAVREFKIFCLAEIYITPRFTERSLGNTRNKHRMAIKGKKSSSKLNAKEVSKRATSPQASLTTLDQDQVLKAMLAASKGKARDTSESGSEDEEDYSEGSDAESSRAGQASDDSDGDGSRASSSSSRPRGTKRSRSPSLNFSDDDDVPEAPRVPASSTAPSRIAEGTSRVKSSASRPAEEKKSDPFDTPKASSSATFASLGLSKPLISALQSINITKPTEIQSACVKPILEGRDCIGGAKTGSGKTMAFALPIVERIARDPYGIWAVVLTPTR